MRIRLGSEGREESDERLRIHAVPRRQLADAFHVVRPSAP
jgi:hypothetical protein